MKVRSTAGSQNTITYCSLATPWQEQVSTATQDTSTFTLSQANENTVCVLAHIHSSSNMGSCRQILLFLELNLTTTDVPVSSNCLIYEMPLNQSRFELKLTIAKAIMIKNTQTTPLSILSQVASQSQSSSSYQTLHPFIHAHIHTQAFPFLCQSNRLFLQLPSASIPGRAADRSPESFSS